MSNQKLPAMPPNGSLPRKVQCLLTPELPAVMGEWKCSLVIKDNEDDEGAFAVFRRSDEPNEIGTIFLRWPDADLLVHECVHAAAWMVKRGGIQLDDEAYADDDYEEKVAHATGYLASKLLPALNDEMRDRSGSGTSQTQPTPKP